MSEGHVNLCECT